MRDITQRRLLEREVLDIGAREQRRVGYDLHDGLGQVLTGLALKTKTLEDMVSGSPDAAALAKQILAHVNSCIRQTRSLAHGLDPVHVEAEGFPPALQALAAQCSELLGVDCQFETDSDHVPVNSEVGLQLYRIAQEAIHNAVRHGKARKVPVKLAGAPANCAWLSKTTARASWQKSRANWAWACASCVTARDSIGGSLGIDERPSGGTVVICRLPLNRSTKPPQ